MESEQQDTRIAGSYVGPATVVASSGEIPVDAELTTGRAVNGAEWSGQLEAAESVNVFAVGTGPCVLRMPDGREGIFVPGSVTVGTGVIPVTGRGPAPFGAGG